MTYKDAIDAQNTKTQGVSHIPYRREHRIDLARQTISAEVLQQYYWEAVLTFQGNLDAMGRGIYLYWNESGAIIDIATVPLDECGDPPAGSAPVAHLLEEFKIPHAVAPYRYGGIDWMNWGEAQNMMQDVAEKARQWVREMIRS